VRIVAEVVAVVGDRLDPCWSVLLQT
jgi:hypothetical protein